MTQTQRITSHISPRPSSVPAGEDRHVLQVMLVVASVMAVGDEEAWRLFLRQDPVLQEAGHVQAQQQSAVIVVLSHTTLTVTPRGRGTGTSQLTRTHAHDVVSP